MFFTVTNGTLLQGKDESKGRIAIEIVVVETFASEEAKSFVQFHGSSVVDFGFKSNLESHELGLQVTRGRWDTSSASFATIASTAIRTSFVAMPLPLCFSGTASIAI